MGGYHIYIYIYVYLFFSMRKNAAVEFPIFHVYMYIYMYMCGTCIISTVFVGICVAMSLDLLCFHFSCFRQMLQSRAIVLV